VGIMLYCAPQLAFIILMSDYLLSDFKISAVLVFTREASKTKWIYKKYFEIFLYSLLYVGIQFVVVLACAVIKGNSITYTKFLVAITGIEFMLISISIFTFTIISSTVILKFSRSLVVLGTVFAYLLSLFITLSTSGLFNNVIVKLMPVANSMLRWHSVNYLFKCMQLSETSGFSLTWSLCYWLFLIAITFLVGKLMINRIDMVDIEKEELH